MTNLKFRIFLCLLAGSTTAVCATPASHGRGNASLTIRANIVPVIYPVKFMPPEKNNIGITYDLHLRAAVETSETLEEVVVPENGKQKRELLKLVTVVAR